MRRLIEGRNEGQISSSCCPHWNFYRFLFVGSWPFSSKDSLGRHSKKKTQPNQRCGGRYRTPLYRKRMKRAEAKSKGKQKEGGGGGGYPPSPRSGRARGTTMAAATMAVGASPHFSPNFSLFFFHFLFRFVCLSLSTFLFHYVVFFFGSFRPFHGHSSGQRTGRQVNRQRKRKKKRNTKIERRRRRRGRRKGRNWRDRRSGKRQQHKRRLLFRVLPSRTGSPWPARMIVDEQEIKQIKRISMEVEPWKRIPVEKEETRGLKKKVLKQ